MSIRNKVCSGNSIIKMCKNSLHRLGAVKDFEWQDGYSCLLVDTVEPPVILEQKCYYVTVFVS